MLSELYTLIQSNLTSSKQFNSLIKFILNVTHVVSTDILYKNNKLHKHEVLVFTLIIDNGILNIT